jgi:hypothetical protein
MAGMTSANESAVLLVSLLPSVMGALGYQGRATVKTLFQPVLRKSDAQARVQRTHLGVAGLKARGTLLPDLGLPWVG